MATEPAAATVPATSGPDESNPTVSSPATNSAKSSDPVSGDELPSAETQGKTEELIVLDREGKSHAFKSLYQGPDAASRVLVIFIRHFFCGSCQEFLRTLCEAISPADLQRLPTSTSIAIVGCGDPGLIDFYATETNCPFPIFADPKRNLYDELDMVMSLEMGSRPAYIRQNMARLIAASIRQAFKHITTGLASKGGESRQNGGEFLFEPSGEGEEKKVTWCHRMRNTRDHAGVPELSRILDPEGRLGRQNSDGSPKTASRAESE